MSGNVCASKLTSLGCVSSLFFPTEVIFRPSCVAFPSASRAHPEEPAAGGREETPGPGSQSYHCHPHHSGGLLRAILYTRL